MCEEKMETYGTEGEVCCTVGYTVGCCAATHRQRTFMVENVKGRERLQAIFAWN
jgi:hypothetical protein